MSLGLPVERPAERVAQPVGFGVQQGVYKLPVPSLFQINLDVPKVALELVDDGLKGMSFPSPLYPLRKRWGGKGGRGRTSQGYLGRAVGTHN